MAQDPTSFKRDPGGTIDKIFGTLCKKDPCEAGLFTTLQQQLYENVCRASGVDPADERPRRPLISANDSELPPMELVETYLRNTPFLDLLLAAVPFHIPMSARFQHQWIITYQCPVCGHVETIDAK